ncbi:hypothetical protein Tco_0558420 [Tanacetum coccineum]
MAAPVGGNVLARRVVDDLIDFSGQTSVMVIKNFYKAQQIAKATAVFWLLRAIEELKMKEAQLEGYGWLKSCSG